MYLDLYEYDFNDLSEERSITQTNWRIPVSVMETKKYNLILRKSH